MRLADARLTTAEDGRKAIAGSVDGLCRLVLAGRTMERRRFHIAQRRQSGGAKWFLFICSLTKVFSGAVSASATTVGLGCLPDPERTAMLIAVNIEPDGDKCGNCHGCCNLAGDRQWVAKCGGINEGHEDMRGPECFLAEITGRDTILPKIRNAIADKEWATAWSWLQKSPTGLQLSRRKGFDLQEHSMGCNGLSAVNVARPSRYGNPHRVGWCEICGAAHTVEEAVAKLAAEIDGDPIFRERIRGDLRGKNLACWCKIRTPCHRDVLLRIANAEVLKSNKSV